MVSASEVSEWLSGTLNPNPNIRMTAELKLSALSSNPDTSLALSEIIVSQDADMALRQSAIILLRKYVREHWSPYFQNFQGNAPPVEVKDRVRRAVFQGLSDPNRRIRSLCASVIKFIANCDWPDEYPDLLENLISLISSGSLDSVHGAMQVFTEFIKADLSEDQIMPVLRDLLPVMHRILGESQQSPFTRARTISVFRQCTISLYTVKEQYSTAVKEASTVILPAWLEAFKVLLSEDPNNGISPDNWDLLAIRVQIFKALETVHTSFPRALAPYLPSFLDLAIFHLNSLYQAFDRFYLTNTDQPPSSSDEEEAVHLSNLISSILDFIANTVRGGKAKAWFTKEHSQELIACVFRYAQMTVEDEESWAENANSFVAQEDDETQDYSVRIAGFDLLASLMDRNDVQSTSIFQAVIRHVIETSDQARNSGNDHWWKPLEGALSCVGSQAEAIAECISDEAESGRSAPIDVEYLLKDVVPTVLGLQEHPFLQGRGFVFASQYSELLPAQLAGQYFDAAVNVIESNEGSIPVKISAVRAVHNFCKSENTEALVPYMARIAKDMGPFILHTSEDTLSLVLETLSVIVSVDKARWITPELAHDLVQAVLQVWASNVKDPILLSIFPDILESLASADASGVYEVVAKVALPSLCESLSNTTEPWATASAIELINALISADHPMGEGFFAVLAPALFKSLATVEDRDALQNGIVALTLVVRRDCNQLLNWADESGRSGLDYVLTLVAKLLQGEDESAGLTIGDLIIHLLRRAGEAVVPVLPELLRAMVNRMTSAKTASFVQSLIIPFAFLITAQRDTVLSLLETTEVQGRSGLDILIHTWCENAETFQGFWASRVSTLALSQLFMCERPSLQNLTVKGDLIVKEETRNVIMTRSRTKTTPTEFTSVTFPVKALKILIHDLTANGESATIAAAVPEDFPDDDELQDKDWSDEEGPSTKTQQELQFLSDLIGPKGLAFDNDDILEQTEDEDLKNDPISQLNLQEHISTFFKECASRNTGGFSSLVQQLKPEEINVVQAVVQQ
ncbi:ARM repeat-containing protein [Cylindrobasidium torrendii FP15055 ss-10]|uniref:ARM repeat-containing protein n=1 Tax=Cylindrobasidium torrendii FP15055 ss-10 TaxID=1314674 RepID=A0A0D7BUR7_9AGAR|nr:ARM repeat-containing protein [Cylindrobasidium torrendii FP15055 ss-10]